MVAHQLYPLPATQMVRLARDARREGLSFEDFWERAVRPDLPVIMTTTLSRQIPPGCVVWPSDSQASKEWRTVTADVRDAWESAYEALPATGAERALRRLAPLLHELAQLQ